MTIKAYFLISTQHFTPTGGIGSFFRAFRRMSAELNWRVTCVLDQSPSGAGRRLMEASAGVRFVWPTAPLPYTKAEGAPRFGVAAEIDDRMVENFRSAYALALESEGEPDLVLVNTPEAIEAPFASPIASTSKVVFYTHHENLLVPPARASKVFSPAYNEYLYAIPQRNVIVATQSEFNVERMARLKFTHSPIVLPMPIPDPELLMPYDGMREGVLFIGRHEPRKNPKRFAEKVAAAGLPAKVLTNKRGEAKFEKTLREAGVNSFEIRSELTGQAKADFIGSARIAFHPASSESYGYSAMECLAAGLPTVCIEEYEWWRAFEEHGIHAVASRKVAKVLPELYRSAIRTDSLAWIDHEEQVKESWSRFLSGRGTPMIKSVDPEIWDEDKLHTKVPEPSEYATPEPTDYSKSKAFNSDVAVYAPAISAAFVKTLEKQRKPGEKIAGRFSNEDLQFTNPNTRLFFYPWALYSAGQAASTGAAAKKDSWLTRRPRDRRVVLLGDSGGFQVQQGTIKFTSETTGQMLSWLERVADYSMILDFPTGGISLGSLRSHIDRLTVEGHDIEALATQWGFSPGFAACVVQTELNNEQFAKERTTGATKLLNVIQGRNEAESSFWYQRMKGFPFEGWSFAGKHHTQLSMTLRRLVNMYRDGLLKKCRWIHFLGISTLKAGMALTFLQRALRESGYAPDVQISFDSSSPVMAASNGYQAVIGFDLGPDKWVFRTESVALAEHAASDMTISEVAHTWRKGAADRMTVTTYVGNTVPLREMITVREGKRPMMTPDQLAMLIHHNTQAYIEGFRRTYDYLDQKATMERPQQVRHLDALLRAVFAAANPMAVIDEVEPQLDALMLEQA